MTMRKIGYFFLISSMLIGLSACPGGKEQTIVPTTPKKAVEKQKIELLAPVSTGGVLEQGYALRGLRDPFQPFEKSTPAKVAKIDNIKGRTGQLEEFSLSQTRLVGIIWGKEKRALIQDSSGMGYVIKEGMSLGKDTGVVVRISPDSVTIRQKFEDYRGHVSTRDVVLTLRKEEEGEM